MSNIINCVMDTYSKNERQRIIDFVLERQPLDYSLSDYDGFELFGIFDGLASFVGVNVARCMVSKYHYKHFGSIDEFIRYHN